MGIEIPPLQPPWSRLALVRDDTALFDPATMDALDEHFSGKADGADVDAALATKADVATVDAALAAKADAAATTAALATKANASSLATKADAAATTAALATKTTRPDARAEGKAGRGIIALIFDDNWIDQYTFAAVELEARGMRATFAVNPSTFGGTGRMSSAQVADLYARGHEIANHTQNHVDMTTQTDVERAAAWDDAQAGITALGIPAATTFVYPYNKTTLTIDQQCYLRFDRALAGNNIPYLEPLSDRDTFLHGRWSWSNDTSSIHARMLNFIRMAATMDVVLIAFAHKLLDSTTAGDGNLLKTQLTEALDLAASLGVAVVPANVALPRFNRLPDAGMESTNTLYHRVTANGSSTLPTGNTYTSVVESPMSNYYAGARFKRFTGDGTVVLRDIQDAFIPIRSSEPMTLSARYRQARTSGGGFRLVIQEFDSYGTQIGADILGTLRNTTVASWTQDTLDYTPSASARSFSVGWIQDSMVGTTDCDHMSIDLKRRPALG